MGKRKRPGKKKPIASIGEDTALAAISTFSGGGIGDVGIEWGCKIPVISACELVPDRAGLIRHNFPHCEVFEGDIYSLESDICRHAKKTLGKKRPWLVIMSPPCQGMSSNGVGRINTAIKEGKRPQLDPRNRLVLPSTNIVSKLKPDWFILENVRRMENTIIEDENGETVNILEMLARRLHPLGYTIRSAIMDFRGLGVPHHRKRLITIGCRLPNIVEKIPPLPSDKLFCSAPTPLHPQYVRGEKGMPAFISLRESIGHMNPLDAGGKTADKEDPFHQIPKWNDNQLFWMEHTPEGETALDNDTCASCGHEGHEAKDTLCKKCNLPLPKPQMVEKIWNCAKCGTDIRKNISRCLCGEERPDNVKLIERRRKIRGFRSAYRRLKWDEPASTLTMNSGVISSDMKGHPDQNRVLSVREILLLSTLEAHPGADYPWDKRYAFISKRPDGSLHHDGEFTPKLVRQVIGESIPPLAMATIVGHLLKIDGRVKLRGRYSGIKAQGQRQLEMGIG